MKPSGEKLIERHAAFTRVDLAVVVAMIAVLLPIVFSAYAAPRNRVYQVTDASNQRRLMQATISFTLDHTDSLPNSGWSTPAGTVTCWAYNAPVPAGAGGTSAAYVVQLPGQLAAVTNGLLFPYLHDSRVFMCPADRPDNPLFFARIIQICSYAWNGVVNGYTSGRSSYKLSQFRPDAILQWECDETVPFYFNDCVNYPNEGISSRHGTNAMVGMFGGGVAPITVKDFNAIAANTTFNRLWCNPGSANGH